MVAESQRQPLRYRHTALLTLEKVPAMPFLIVVLTLFAVLLAADAEVDAAASDGPESVRVERVLIAGQIDSSTVDVGAFVVIVYGQGERHPVSGGVDPVGYGQGFHKSRRFAAVDRRLGTGRVVEVDRLGAHSDAEPDRRAFVGGGSRSYPYEDR